jgi:hypothetical protein
VKHPNWRTALEIAAFVFEILLLVFAMAVLLKDD